MNANGPPPPDAGAIRRGARFEVETLQTGPALLAALVDYRGDVTIEQAGGELVGYLFEVAASPTRVRVLPADGGAAVTVSLENVRAITVTGRDTAEGKSFETWVRKYAEHKLGLMVKGGEEERG